MIALSIVLVVFLALMQTALVGIDANMMNALRNEALVIADLKMNEARNVPFAALVSDIGSLSGCDCPSAGLFPYTTGDCETRSVRSIPNFNFCANTTVVELGGDGSLATDDADNRQVNITVGWKWKGEDYTHRVTTIRKR